LQQEARSQAVAELAGSDLESKFAQLSAGAGVDDELEMMKQQMLGSAPAPQGALPGTATSATQPTGAQPVADKEIEDLRKKIDSL
jgi:phage shock protein A